MKHRMQSPTQKNLEKFRKDIESVDPAHKKDIEKFIKEEGEAKVFRLLHAMRRWYSGQTMSHVIEEGRDTLKKVMPLDIKVPLYRGFKVPKENDLAKVNLDETGSVSVSRNRGISSWTESRSIADKFSGKTKTHTGLVVELQPTKDVQVILAPQSQTKPWFNDLYEKTMGKSFREKENEYVIKSNKLPVKFIAVKGPPSQKIKVKSHTRKQDGKPITVKSHFRGSHAGN